MIVSSPMTILCIALAMLVIACSAPVEPLLSDERDGVAIFGFSPGAELRQQDDAHLAGDLAAMAEIGAAWVRLDVDWSVVEAERGRYDWSANDRLVDAAIAADLDVLGMLAYTPAWARPPGTDDKHPPIDDEGFAEFAAAAVARYGPSGVRAWEVWNEPNSALFWSTGPDPAGYGRLLRATAAAIRSADPDATIVSGGLAPGLDRPDDGWLSPETFLDELVRAGALVDVDAVGVHPYSYPARPFDPDSAAWNTFLRLPALYELIAETGAGPTCLWITEYGAPTGDHDRAVSESEQAAMLVESLDAADRWPWLGPILLYAMRDFRQAPDDLEWNFGILRVDGTPKRAWHELLARRTERTGTDGAAPPLDVEQQPEATLAGGPDCRAGGHRGATS